MRNRKKPWTDKEIAESSVFIEDATLYKGKWSEVFGNDNPIHIEIGCGKGQFISETSKTNPNINYIGIERERLVIAAALKKARLSEAGKNLRFLCVDVANINDIFAPGEVERIYINFCDPWHRRRKWAKRRLTHRNFLALYEQLFGENGGEIYMKTDNTILFDFSLNEFADKGWRLHNISLNLHESDYEGNIMTEYEQKFSALGQPIYRLEAYFKRLPEGVDDKL